MGWDIPGAHRAGGLDAVGVAPAGQEGGVTQTA